MRDGESFSVRPADLDVVGVRLRRSAESLLALASAAHATLWTASTAVPDPALAAACADAAGSCRQRLGLLADHTRLLGSSYAHAAATYLATDDTIAGSAERVQ